MTGGKRLRIAALFVIVLVFAFIMDMSSNAITDNTLIRNDTGDGDAVYDLVLNADGLDEDYSYQLKLKEEQPSDKQANELFTQAKKGDRRQLLRKRPECRAGQRTYKYEGCICIGSCGGRVDTE